MSNNYISELREVINIFNSLKIHSKRTDKIDILTRNKDNELFKSCLDFLLNPSIVTGISDKKLNKDITGFPAKTIGNIYELMRYLLINNTGKDENILCVKCFVNSLPSDCREFCNAMITKNFKCGVDAKTVNSVFVGFIPTFDVMLANKYYDKPELLDGKREFAVTLKLDGIRCIVIIRDNKVEFYSRQGQKIEGLVDIERELLSLSARNYVLDGELVMKNYETLSNKENYKQTIKIVRKKDEKHDVKLATFDCLSNYEWLLKERTVTYSNRRDRINNLMEDINWKGEYVSILPILYKGTDKDKMLSLLQDVLEKNQEGLMINFTDSMYEFKRTDELLKVKVMQDADLLVTGVYEGTNRNAGRLGGITVKFEHDGKYYEIDCGSGFKDDERDYYWSHKDELIGKIVTIQYYEITENADGGYGMRFPVWINRIRDDKTDISMN